MMDLNRVVSVVLPRSQLLGSIPPDLGSLEHLQRLDLSENYFNGTLPAALFNASELRLLSLGNNELSGEVPDTIGGLRSLNYLNLSDNAFGGAIPRSLSNMVNLTIISLRGNYFSGNVPVRFDSAQVIDLSSNLFNGPFPSTLGGSSTTYMNLSYNNFSGELPSGFASNVPVNSTIDLSFNDLTGQIPNIKTLQNQNSQAFAGNPELCGMPLKTLCTIPSTLSRGPNSTTSVTPAIAVIPRTIGGSDISSNNSSALGTANGRASGFKPATIVGITLADLAGICFIGFALLCLYNIKSRKQNPISTSPKTLKPNPQPHTFNPQFPSQINNHPIPQTSSPTQSPTNNNTCCCLKSAIDDPKSSSSSSCSEDNNHKNDNVNAVGSLIMVDRETEMEMETLLKATAYILGASGTSIVYKAVLEDGTAFAVRRLGDRCCVETMKEFEREVRAMGKMKHGNLVRVRGFYWGRDERLLVSDFVSNGCLGTAISKKVGSSPSHLPLEVRLRIARGVARGLAYIQEKKIVHGNITPSNILLTPEMEPMISDLGLSLLINGTNTTKGTGSGRQFGSKRSTGLHDTAQDASSSGSPFTNPITTGPVSPYQAPESLKNLKPNLKWDVYSFGIVLLELLTGKVFVDRDLAQWASGSVVLEDRYWALRMADVAIRAEVQGREEDMVGIFKLGFSCASFAPHKRPSMRDALHVLERSPMLQS